MPVTLADIATRLELDPSTVSLVLNAKKYRRVSTATRFRIEQAAKEMGYAPNRHAQVLIHGKSMAIALLIRNMTNPFAGQYVAAIEERLSPHGYHLFPFESHRDPAREKDFLALCAQGVCDGVINLELMEFNTARWFESAYHLPLVIRYESSHAAESDERSASYVPVDYEDAIHHLMDHLKATGRRIVGFLEHEENNPYPPGTSAFPSPRATCLNSAVRRSGLFSNASLCRFSGGREDMRLWHDMAHDLLSREPRIDALIVKQAQMVPAVLTAARAMGRRVGEDLALATYDDPDVLSWLSPPITAIYEPIHRVASQLAAQMLARLKGEKSPADEVVHAQLVIRDSTAGKLRNNS